MCIASELRQGVVDATGLSDPLILQIVYSILSMECFCLEDASVQGMLLFRGRSWSENTLVQRMIRSTK